MKGGIYMIINTINNNKYIGSSKDVLKRITRHKVDLKRKTHPNQHLQRAWDKYSTEAFVFEVLELCDLNILIQREQFYLDTIKPEYNMCKIANSCAGRVVSEEARRKQSEARKGIKFSEEHREKLSKAKIGTTRIITEEHRQKISQAHIGKKRSKESREKHSKTNTGKPWSEARRLAQDKYRINCKLSIEQINQIRYLLKEDKLTQTEIGNLFGVSRRTIGNIKLNRTYNKEIA